MLLNIALKEFLSFAWNIVLQDNVYKYKWENILIHIDIKCFVLSVFYTEQLT